MAFDPRHIPPFRSLLAFHAAATHDRLIEAARTLGVTESAISHQLRSLEERLGVPLFDRTGGRLRLTESGDRYLAEIEPALAAVARATASLNPTDRRVVRLTLPPSLAVVWVIPRLGQFEAAHPGIELQLIPTTRVIDLARDRIDLAIRHGVGPWPGVEAFPLFEDRATPVCAPDYPVGDMLTPDLRYLANRGIPGEWEEWSRARGIAPPPSEALIELDSIEQALTLAQAGHGIAIGRAPHLEPLLASGALIAPFGPGAAGGAGFHLCQAASVDQPAQVRRVSDWLRGEAQHVAAT